MDEPGAARLFYFFFGGGSWLTFLTFCVL